MKKVFPMLLLAANFATAPFTHAQQADPLKGPAASELAPAETIVFLEAPDVARTLTRWKLTGLFQITQESEWKEFTAKWDDFVASNEQSKVFFSVYDQVRKIDPAGGFVAVSKVMDPQYMSALPKLVAGLRYGGKKSDVEGVVGLLRDQLHKTWPEAKSEKFTFEEIEIETITNPKAVPDTSRILGNTDATKPEPVKAEPRFSQVLVAYRDNWLFLATDKDLLTGTLARYLKKADATPALAKDAIFQETLKHGTTDPDVTLWVSGKLVDAVKTLQAGLRADAGTPPAAKDVPNPYQAFLYSGKFEGPIIRERFYTQTVAAPKPGAFDQHSVALTTADTYTYAVLDFPTIVAQLRSVMPPPLQEEMEKDFAKHDLKADDVFAAFGPELLLASAWPGGAIAVPDFSLAVEVRDAANARKVADYIVSEMSKSKPMDMTTEGGVTRWVAPDGVGGVFRPTLALTEHHLVFGISPAAVTTLLKQVAAKGPNIATKPASPQPAALQTVKKADVALIYLDAKTLFERVYSKGRPFLAFQLVGAPELAKYFDSGLLPHDTTFSKHLTPIVLSVSTDGPGWLVESTGTVTLLGLYSTAIPVGAFFIAVPSPSQIQPAK